MCMSNILQIQKIQRVVFATAILLFANMQLKAERDTLRVYFSEAEQEISGFQQSLIDIFVSTHFAAGEIIVSGHTDNIGDPSSNLGYSKNRAKIVAEYLLQKGLNPEKMVLEAWGETKPLFPNNSAVNRARNRRVEIIGIPKPEKSIIDQNFPGETRLSIGNDTEVRYREMTTPAGFAKRIWVIRLAKDTPIFADLIAASPAGILCGTILIPRKDCKTSRNFIFQIPASEQLRCPISEIQFESPEFNHSKENIHGKSKVLAPVSTDSGYVFNLELKDMRECYPTTYTLGDGCYSEHLAKIRVHGIKMQNIEGNIPSIRQRIKAKISDDGTFELMYINDDPSTLLLQGHRKNGGRSRRRLALKKLSDLPIDRDGTYILKRSAFRK